MVHKVLQDIGINRCNGFSTTTEVDSPLGKDENSTEANIDWANPYFSIIGMMLYLPSRVHRVIFLSGLEGFSVVGKTLYERRFSNKCNLRY